MSPTGTNDDDNVRRLDRLDALTGLPDRRAFLNVLDAALRRAADTGHGFAVLFLDLERFREINEIFGHRTGDRVLAITAERLRHALDDVDVPALGLDEAPGDTATPSSPGPAADAPSEFEPAPDGRAARLGGDEFGVLIAAPGPAAVLAVARHLQAVVSEPIALGPRRLVVVPSVGVARFPRDGDDARMLLVRADVAAARARRSTGERLRFHDETLHERESRRAALESALHHALERGELSLRFQPQRHLASGAVSGVEALLRWHEPTLGTVPPLSFLPLAERNGAIVPIGAWVLGEACRRAAGWRSDGLTFGRVSVNVSSVQFARPDFPASVAGALADAGLEPDALELELTESVLMDDAVLTLERLHALKALGVRLAIDDFGSGWSSLAWLRRFPVDRLKIDRAFVDTALSDVDERAIASTVIAMGDRMRLSVTAEGVESGAQLRFLEDERCDEVQGFGIGRPMSARAIEAFLRDPPAHGGSFAPGDTGGRSSA